MSAPRVEVPSPPGTPSPRPSDQRPPSETADRTGKGRFTEPLDPLAERAADSASDRFASTWRAPAAVAAVSFVAIVATLVAAGWLLAHSPLGEPVRSWDETLSRDLSVGRSPGWDDYSSVGTSGADTMPVVAAMVLVSAVLAVLRRWRDLLFLPLALALELSVFLSTNYLVARDRPEVSQLGTEPGTHSFPSGHVAATFVVWFGVAVLLGVGRWRRPWRLLAWAVAAVPVVTVAFSRVYRGMHFTTDVLAGMLLGALALGAAAVATRSSWLASGAPSIRSGDVGGRVVTSVAVVAHARKSFGGGLDELRSVLAHAGVEAMWFEVPKSKKAPAAAKEAVARGADLVFVWGGDGTVQRCLDALADSPVDVAILPAGTANLLATNLGVPGTVEEAVEVGLHGARRPLDLGRMNGEHFAVMAGAGLDALMIRDADRGLKDKAGRLAYVWTGIRNVKARRVPMTIDVDGARWFEGDASCVLVANVSTIVGGLAPFERARPDDGVLEIGVVEAEGALQWARVFGRMAVGKVDGSPLTRTTSARRIDIRAAEKVDYELDGGHRGRARRLKIRVRPGAVRLCVPDAAVLS